MNLAHRPTTSSLEDTNDDNREDDYVDPTPYFRSLLIYEIFEILKQILKDFTSL